MFLTQRYNKEWPEELHFCKTCGRVAVRAQKKKSDLSFCRGKTRVNVNKKCEYDLLHAAAISIFSDIQTAAWEQA